VEPPDLPLALVGDPLRLSQVLLNLANNASSSPTGAKWRWRAGRPSAATTGIDLRFELRDTGIGIEQAQRERLFQPFEQADSSTSRRHGGTAWAWPSAGSWCT
jgi:signal transduction histidine kinase